MRLLYVMATWIAAPIAFFVVVCRAIHDPAYRAGLWERLGFGAAAAQPTIWVHAVSLGEVNAAAALVHALRERHPGLCVTLTTATPTGRARALAAFGTGVTVRFLPYDTRGAVSRFLVRTRPRLAVIMETELWPTLYAVCQRRGIPLILASARLSETSLRRYRRVATLSRSVLSAVTWIAAQSPADAQRFIAIGAPAARTTVIGNVKFDVTADAALASAGSALRARQWGSRPTWIAGSTHPGEEEIVLDAHAALRAVVTDALLLLVPRHPARFQGVADLLVRRGVRFDRRTRDTGVRPDSAVLLVDTVGELAELYAAADVAFVGGSLVPIGGHNLLEPAALGIPVLTGPSTSNGRDAARLLIAAGAAIEVGDGDALTVALKGLFAEPARRAQLGARGRAVVDANRGSVARLLELIESLLAAHPPDALRPADSPAAAGNP